VVRGCGSGCRGTEGAAACGDVGAAAARGGGNGGIGLRAGAAADRGGSADILGRGWFCSEALAMSRDICSWLALSCSTSCPRLARSRDIDWSNCAESGDGAAAAGATASGTVGARGAGCGDAAFAASA
jgi:hypothetical protein